MAVDVSVKQQAALFQVGHDVIVGVLDELAGEGVVAGYHTLQVHRLDEGQSLLPPQVQVLVAKGRGDVDDAGAIFHGHEVGGDHLGSKLCGRLQVRHRDPIGRFPARKPAELGPVFGRVIEGLVRRPYQVAPPKGGDYAVFLFDVGFNQRRRQHQPLPAPFVVHPLQNRVLGIGVHGQGGVAGQSPRRGGPGQQVGWEVRR